MTFILELTSFNALFSNHWLLLLTFFLFQFSLKSLCHTGGPFIIQFSSLLHSIHHGEQVVQCVSVTAAANKTLNLWGHKSRSREPALSVVKHALNLFIFTTSVSVALTSVCSWWQGRSRDHWCGTDRLTFLGYRHRWWQTGSMWSCTWHIAAHHPGGDHILPPCTAPPPEGETIQLCAKSKRNQNLTLWRSLTEWS